MEKLIVIGAGPAGIAAAKTAQRLGVAPVMIELTQKLGGTCLNFGCMPTKAYIAAANQINIQSKLKRMGLSGDISFDWLKVRKYVDEVLFKLNKGLEMAFSDIKIIRGKAEFVDNHTVKVNDEIIKAEKIIVATGSEPIELSFLRFDKKRIISSDEALFLSELPESLAIIGGGVIGVEFAYFMSVFGVKVTIYEAMDNILLGIDDEARDEIIKALKKLGVKIILNKKINSADELLEEKILVAVGRKAAQINIPDGDNIYLAGDALKGTPQYAHTAEKEGYAAAIKAIKGENISIDYNLNPACIYSNPEYAFIGLPFKSLESADVDEFKADYSASGMATVYLKTKGFMKVFAEKQTGKIKSVHLLGHNAVELISAFIPAINKGISLDELKNYIYPHPTFCESIRKLRKV